MLAPVAPGPRATVAWVGAWVLATALTIGIVAAPAESLVVHVDQDAYPTVESRGAFLAGHLMMSVLLIGLAPALTVLHPRRRLAGFDRRSVGRAVLTLSAVYLVYAVAIALLLVTSVRQ